MTICKICNKENADGVNILGIRVCEDCLDKITRVNFEDIEYDYYKLVLKKAWIDYIVGAN